MWIYRQDLFEWRLAELCIIFLIRTEDVLPSMQFPDLVLKTDREAVQRNLFSFAALLPVVLLMFKDASFFS